MSKDQMSLPCSFSSSELETDPPGTVASAVVRASGSEILAAARSFACVASSAKASEELKANIDTMAKNRIFDGHDAYLIYPSASGSLGVER